MSQHYKNIFIKFLILTVLFLVVGIPINNLFSFIFILFFIPVIIFSEIHQKKKSLYSLIFVFLFFSVFKYFFPSLNIQEGHNAVVLNNHSSIFYSEHLPKEVYKFFSEEFDNHYSNSQCSENHGRCWKNFNPMKDKPTSSSTNKIFATSSDWSFQEKKYSRIVRNINFSNIQSARIGAANNLDFNFFWPKGSDLTRENIPFFVMYEISRELRNSSICWKGNLFWQKEDDFYLKKQNKEYNCEKIRKSDEEKFIYGASMGSKNDLILKLHKSNKVLIQETIELLIKVLTILFFLRFFFRFNHKLYFLSSLYSGIFVLLVFYVNRHLLSGFDLFSGGNDGLIYASYGNVIFNNFLNFNLYEAFRGLESVFYFPSSIRYFWPLNKFIFGETFFGFILISFLYPIVFFYIFKYLFGTMFSIILTAIVTLTRLFEGYALCVINMIQHINAGDAEPLAIFLLLSSLLIFLKITKGIIGFNSKFYSFLLGFLLFLSVSLRPNFFPTALIFILIFAFYIFKYHKNYKSLFFVNIGFLFILLIPLHNYYYGNAKVLFSSASHYDTFVPISVYYDVIKDLIQLKLNDGIFNIIAQINRWIQPQEIHYIVTFTILLVLLIKNKDFVITTICLLALSQHSVLLIFRPDSRYAYLAWILTIIVNLHFVKNYLLDSKLINKIKRILYN